MDHSYPSIEFEASVGRDGTLVLPKALAGRYRSGSRITVRVTEGTVSSSLRKRGVSEEEIERIARLQLEERGQAILFLSGEGTLAADRPFARRAAHLLGRKA